MGVYSMMFTETSIPLTCKPKSVLYCARVGEFLRIACSSPLYKFFNEKVMELLNRMKVQRTQSFRRRKGLSKIIWRHEKTLLILEKILIKFFLNYLTHETLSAALSFCYIYYWRIPLFQQFFLSLTHENFSVAFSFLWRMNARFFSYMLCLYCSFEKVWNACSVYNILFLVFFMYKLRFSSDSFVDIWGIHYWPTCTHIFHHIY